MSGSPDSSIRKHPLAVLLPATLLLSGGVGLGCGRLTDPAPSARGARVESTSTVEVGHTEALVGARIDASSSGSRYWCWYGQSRVPDSLAVEGSLEASAAPVDVRANLKPLRPDTRYYVRWTVSVAGGEPSDALDSLRTLPRNRSPETLLTVVVVDSIDGVRRVHAVWRGLDSDGQTVAFDVTSWEGGGEVPWARTAGTDSVLSMTAGSGRRFMVRAVDDDGAVDPTPAFAWLKAEGVRCMTDEPVSPKNSVHQPADDARR